MRYLSFDIGIKNLGVVKLNIDDGKISNVEAGLIDLTGGQKTKKIPFGYLIDSLFYNLDKIKIDDIDEVIIENQPALMNPICKSLSIALYSYFRLKDKKTRFVSATRKLGKEGKKLSYKEKKNQAIIECFKLIDEKDKLNIETLTRQHDIADAILQAYNYDINKK